mgnify:CR=1 FL=1
MAEAVDLQVVFKLIGTMTQATDLSTLEDVLARDYGKTFANGTGANQLNMWWHDQRTLAASAAEDLDLAGSLLSAFGTTITFTSLKGLMVFAATANTNNVNVTRPAANGVPWLLAAGDGIAVKPGMWMAWFDPSANGSVVTAGTGDLITFTNSAGGTSVLYDAYLFGEV